MPKMTKDDWNRLGFDLVAEVDYDIAKKWEHYSDPSQWEENEPANEWLSEYPEYVIQILRNYGFTVLEPGEQPKMVFG